MVLIVEPDSVIGDIGAMVSIPWYRSVRIRIPRERMVTRCPRSAAAIFLYFIEDPSFGPAGGSDWGERD